MQPQTDKVGETLHALDPGEIFLWHGEFYRVEPDPAEGKCDRCGNEESKHPCPIPPPAPPTDKRKRQMKLIGGYCDKYEHRVYQNIILVQCVEVLTDNKGQQRIFCKHGRDVENFNAYWRLKKLEDGIWKLYDDRTGQ